MLPEMFTPAIVQMAFLRIGDALFPALLALHADSKALTCRIKKIHAAKPLDEFFVRTAWYAMTGALTVDRAAPFGDMTAPNVAALKLICDHGEQAIKRAWEDQIAGVRDYDLEGDDHFLCFYALIRISDLIDINKGDLFLGRTRTAEGNPWGCASR